MEKFDDKAKRLRAGILVIAAETRTLQDFSVTAAEQSSEMHANIMLAFRHLEDARMRLGKAIQAYDGGVSVYDKTEGGG